MEQVRKEPGVEGTTGGGSWYVLASSLFANSHSPSVT